MARTRTRTRNGQSGTRVVNFLGSISTDSRTPQIKNEVCTDSTGRTTDHALQIDRTDRTGAALLNGTRVIGTGPFIIRQYNNWMPDAMNASVSHLATSMPSVGASATTLIARSNPGRIQVSVPNFIFELKDLPGMLKEVGDLRMGKLPTSAREFANWHLSLTMGWQPFISDIRRMLAFQRNVDKRISELSRLYSKGGLKRRIILENVNTSDSSSIGFGLDSGTGDSLTAKVDTYTHSRRWGTIRWVPTSLPIVPANSPDYDRYVRSLVLGLNNPFRDGGVSSYGLQAWNAIPWTWLIDWFVNVGDYLAAYRNVVPASHSVPCIMTQTTTVKRFTRTDTFKEYTGGSGVIGLVTKKRDLADATLTAALPFLGARHLSILAALSVQRMRWKA